jgi:predicted cobalt transporter CbtA
MRHVVYDAGVLVAADRDQRTVWADHRAGLERTAVVLGANVVTGD